MIARMSTQPYVLGTTDLELERLRFQHEVWGPVTRAFLARLGLRRGMRVLDLGAGPGFVALEIATVVGPEGRVVARAKSERGAANLEIVTARIQDARFDAQSFDIVFARWVFSFLADPVAAARSAAGWLVPGGVLAIEDYNHEGISLFPPSAGFRAVVRGTRALYSTSGGDAFVMGRALEILAGAGLETPSLVPHVMCGAPGSGVWRWADLFFPPFAHVMRAKGLISEEELASFQAEWTQRSADPGALFYSPVVVDAAGRKPLH
jgi:SAM-dependent methyltransferase